MVDQFKLIVKEYLIDELEKHKENIVKMSYNYSAKTKKCGIIELIFTNVECFTAFVSGKATSKPFSLNYIYGDTQLDCIINSAGDRSIPILYKIVNTSYGTIIGSIILER